MKNQGVVVASLPGPHFRSEAGFSAKKIIARSILCRLPLTFYRQGPRGSEMVPHLLSLWVWVAETLTQERKISSVLFVARTADIANRSRPSLPQTTLRILLNTGLPAATTKGSELRLLLGEEEPSPGEERRACRWVQEARADTGWRKED